MSTILYELPDRYVLDTGEVVGKHMKAVRMLLAGKRLDGHMFAENADLQQFVKFSDQTPILWAAGEEGGPAPDTFTWQIPAEFKSIVLSKWIETKFTEYMEEITVPTMEQITVYERRLGDELRLISDLGMEDFVRALIYIIDVFRKNNVVWGVGRGSSVESLVLFLIGVHMIDPVLHGIPLDHFFRHK